MFRSKLEAGASSCHCGSSVVGSTPWAITILPSGAARAAAGRTSSPRRASVAQRRVMVSLLSGHAVAGACAATSWVSRACPRESSAPGWCDCTSVVQLDEAVWPVVLPEGNMKPLVIWLPVQVVSGTECAVVRLSDGSLHAGSAGPSVQHHEDHQREARGARQSDRADQHTVSRAPQHPRGEGRHYSGGMDCRPSPRGCCGARLTVCW